MKFIYVNPIKPTTLQFSIKEKKAHPQNHRAFHTLTAIKNALDNNFEINNETKMTTIDEIATEIFNRYEKRYNSYWNFFQRFVDSIYSCVGQESEFQKISQLRNEILAKCSKSPKIDSLMLPEELINIITTFCQVPDIWTLRSVCKGLANSADIILVELFRAKLQLNLKTNPRALCSQIYIKR